LGQPKTSTVTIKSVTLKPGSKIMLLGEKSPLVWSQQGEDVKVTLPAKLAGNYAYVLRMTAS